VRLFVCLLLCSCTNASDVADGSPPSDAPIADAPVASDASSDAMMDAAKPLGPPRLYVGSSDGMIRIFAFDDTTFALTPTGATPAGSNPSFLAFTPDRKFLYAADEGMSRVRPFAIDPQTGALSPLATVMSMGSGPAHVSTDRTGNLVMVANYGGGTIAIFPRAQDGTLMAPSATRSYGGNAQTHQIIVDPTNGYVLVPNKGLDAVAAHKLTGTMLSDLPAAPSGDGARHIAFDPAGTHAYVIDELGSTVSAFNFLPINGVLASLQTISSLADGGVQGNTGAEIQVTPDGTHVLVSNRGDNSIVSFLVDAQTGKLSAPVRVPTGGNTPRHFMIEETGRFLFVGNQNSGTVVVMKMNAGVPSPVGTPLSVPNPAFAGLIYLPR
jgi:6-phosphogluconolactonase